MNRTLHHGLRVLELLAARSGPVSVTAAANALGLAKSQTHRLLRSLVGTGYVVQLPDRRYRTALKVLGLTGGIMLHHPLRLAALPVVRAVGERLGQEAVLSVLCDGRALVLATDHPDGRQRDPFSVLGQAAPLHAWANGKTLLAWQPHADRERLLAGAVLTRYTPRTITERERLVTELDGIRQRGWALNDRENAPDVISLAVPVLDRFRRCLAALGTSWPPGALPAPARRTAVISILQQGAQEIARAVAARASG